jgi:hypothetical protein
MPIIENGVNERLNKESRKHYNKINNKIDNLTKQLQGRIHSTNKQTFYPRLRNMTNIRLTEKEEKLLNKGSKYSMGISPKCA